MTTDPEEVYPPRSSAYALLNTISSGTFATIYKAELIETKQYLTIKLIPVHKIGSRLQEFQDRLRTLINSPIPFTTRVLQQFVSRSSLWIVQQYLPYDSMIGLRSINTNMKEKHIPLIIKAGLMGLKEIHGRKMIHGDVKAGNILSDGAGKFFLDDVGTTGILYEMYYRTSDPHYFSAPSWFAPEYFRPEVPLTTAIDIWSMGITALELYHGMAPFSNFTPREVVSYIRSSRPDIFLNPNLARVYSSTFVSFIEKCLTYDAAKRPTASELLEHPFITGEAQDNRLVRQPHLPFGTSHDGPSQSPRDYSGHSSYRWEESAGRSYRTEPSRTDFSNQYRRDEGFTPSRSRMMGDMGGMRAGLGSSRGFGMMRDHRYSRIGRDPRVPFSQYFDMIDRNIHTNHWFGAVDWGKDRRYRISEDSKQTTSITGRRKSNESEYYHHQMEENTDIRGGRSYLMDSSANYHQANSSRHSYRDSMAEENYRKSTDLSSSGKSRYIGRNDISDSRISERREMSHSPSRSMKSDKNSHYERTVSQRGDRNEYALISDPRDREKLFSIPFVETTKPTEMEPKVELHNMEQRSEARHEPRTEQRYDSRTEQRHEPRTEQKHESRTEQRYDPRTEQRHEPRSEQRYEPKAEQRHEPRTEQRHEMHTEPSFEARFEPKIEYKMESRTEQTSDRYVDRSIEMHEQLSRSPGEVQRASDFNMDSFNLNLSEALEKKMESRKKRNLYDGTLTIDAGLRLLERDAVKQKQAKSAPPNGVISHGIRIENRIHGRNEIRQFEDMNATQRMEAMKLVLRTRFFEKLGQSITEILVQKKDLSERETEIEQEIEQIQHEEEMEQEREREKAEEEERERREREIASKVKADKIREKRRELEQKKEMKREKAREREREKARAKEQARQENKKGRPRTEDNEREDNDEKKEPIGLHYKTERSEMLRDRDTSTESGVRDEMGTSESSTDNKKDQDYIQNGKKKKLKVSRELSGLLMSEKVKGGRSRKLTKKELRLQSLEEEDEERETGRRVFTEHEEGAETYRRGVTEYGSDDESSGFLSTPNGTPSFSRIVEVGDQISPSNSPNRKGVSQATFSDLEKGRIGRPVGSGKKVIEPDDDSVGEDGDDWMREDKGAKKEGKSKAERLSTSRRPHKNTHDRLKTPRIGSGRVSQATQRARAEYRRQQEFMEPLHFRFLVKDTDEEDLRDDKLALVVAAENAGLPLEDLFPDVVQQLGVGNRPDMSSVYEMPYALNLFMRDKKLLDRESARHRSNSSRRRLTLGAGKKKDSQMSLNKVLPYANAKIDWTSLDYDALERYRDHQVIQAIDEEKFVPMNEDMEPPFVTPPPGMPMYFSGSSVPLNTIEHLRQFVLAHPTHPFMSIPSFDPTRHMSMELGEFVGMLERRREEMIEDLRDRLMRDLRPDEQMGQRKKLDDEVMKPIEDPPMQPLLAEVENEVGPTLQPSTFSNFTSVFPRKWNALTWPTGENTEIDNQITRILQKRAFTPDSIPRNTTPPQSRTSSPVPRSTSNRSTPRPHISERRRLEQIKQEAQSSCQRCRPFTLNMCRGMLLKQFEDPVLVYSPTFESLTGPQSYLFNQGPQTSRPDGEFVVDQERNKTVKGGSEPFIEYLPLGSGIPKHPEGKFFSPTAMVVGYSSTDKGTPAPPIIHPSATSLSLRQMPVAFERSKIHDWGLYAMVDIEERHVVVEYVGEVIRSSVAQKRENLYIQQGNPSSYLFQVDPYCIIDATKTGNNARYINHSCDPNCFAEIINDDGVRKVVIFAKRKIYMGEEITYDYKFSDEPEETKVKCTCGAPNCKRTLN